MRLGEYDRTVKDKDEKDVSFESYYTLSRYESTTTGYDIAIILLKYPVYFKDTIESVHVNKNFDFTGKKKDLSIEKMSFLEQLIKKL